ncbi:MAG: hypothetical protein JEY94_17580 [Melioribacteraceae bacterium]|nr:hypothetical protein [Melioribacteraceae bacterium]
MAIIVNSCINPFAPELDNELNSNGGALSDQLSVGGVFQNFQYAYTFKDTSIYGQLLDKDFIFSYRDYDKSVDVSWSREEEMKVSYGLFLNAQRLDLVWNNIVSITGDSTNIIRSFNLTVTFNPTDIILVSGKVNLTLKKDENKKWKILNWVDESNF